jgi:hypothetical protein
VIAASEFVTYLWHYVVARLLYDDFVRRLVHGHVPAAVSVVAIAMLAFAVGRLTRRRT